MQCPICGQNDTSVTNSRSSAENSIWRRRHCENCQTVFTTYEKIDLDKILKIKRPEAKKPVFYSRPKLQLSLLKACAHLQHLSGLKLEYLVTIVENQALRASSEGIIDINQLKIIVSKTLQRFDPVAFLNYSSSHGLDTTGFIKLPR